MIKEVSVRSVVGYYVKVTWNHGDSDVTTSHTERVSTAEEMEALYNKYDLVESWVNTHRTEVDIPPYEKYDEIFVNDYHENYFSWEIGSEYTRIAEIAWIEMYYIDAEGNRHDYVVEGSEYALWREVHVVD